MGTQAWTMPRQREQIGIDVERCLPAGCPPHGGDDAGMAKWGGYSPGFARLRALPGLGLGFAAGRRLEDFAFA